MSNKRKKTEAQNIATAAGISESSALHGEAISEFFKAYTGLDKEAGISLERGHRNISSYKINPEHAINNLRQQAGYSAEVTHVARENAKNILSGNPERLFRTEDVPGFGNNHTVYDHVKKIDGKLVENSGSQMKFVSNIEKQLKRIAEGKGGGKNDHSRYLDGELILPSDQVDKAKEICSKKADLLHKQADALAKKGNNCLAIEKRQAAKAYEDLKDNKIKSAALSSEEAIKYRISPKWETAKDIGRIAHQSGLKGTQLGIALIGGIAILTNIIQVSLGNKKASQALRDVALTTGKSAASGYAIGFGGAAISGAMRQSASAPIRSLANTSLPTLIVSTGIQLSGSIRSLIAGEISNLEFFEQVGQSGTNLLAGSAFAAAGQIAIPIPVIGAMAGSMVGYVLSSIFYQEAIISFKEKKLSAERYTEIRALSSEARKRMELEAELIKNFFKKEVERKKKESDELFKTLDSAISQRDINSFCDYINRFCHKLGYDLEVQDRADLDKLLSNNETLKI